ncbi:MAG: hypothetical protein NTW14_10710 [bacterium]|nr:hypothetical protein [bacterium]
MLAYSAIEEMGLEIRANRDRPSKINGKWNPVVLDDLRDRLLKAGIDINEPLIWIQRGKPTRLEPEQLPEDMKKVEWARGQIRDKDICLYDAIAKSSRLRSKISTHKVPSSINHLSIQDVINIQALARRLILESLGFWRLTTIGQ